MPLDKRFIGRSYGPFTYELGLEKMREFSLILGGSTPRAGTPGAPPAHLSPLLYDEAAAKAGPYGDVIASPSFAVVFAIQPFSAAIADPELGVDMVKLVHGEQELEFLDVMKPGDVLTTTGSITALYDKAGLDFLVVTTESKNPQGQTVVRGVWSAVIRQ
ncbi:MaoC family dehydratase N-terminal domain-containing protein [Corallococcus sp. M34]|uniref:FAS1-like dehydratase domain-containing protein n=1 Tax=Citreicoccus inhibens TaxID=2849499 RepID=UPI001C22B945|nr:MaoC family dehydratase N-terminal domain-containing protein [Citreicoccus inhibens]MBU8900112.1 MaoC family dehydratase N-terminal domain-containing protein [Citreicoccus inhibens]